jgi:hypothetical protein
MGMNELITARARRAAARLEALLAEIEEGRYALSSETAGAVSAHIRRTLHAYWTAVGEGEHDVSDRPRDRRANG